jgi:catechol-2,3-dioxygenase
LYKNGDIMAVSLQKKQMKFGLHGCILVHMALFVSSDEIEHAIKILENNGIDIKIITRGSHTRVYFKDTEDNVIEFYTQSMEEDYFMRLNQGILK